MKKLDNIVSNYQEMNELLNGSPITEFSNNDLGLFIGDGCMDRFLAHMEKI